MKNLLIVCPLKRELNFLLSGFSDMGLKIEDQSHHPHLKSLTLPCYTILDKGFTISLGGHGKAQFGVQSQYLISRLSSLTASPLEGFICLGAAGGLAPHLKVGDIVVGEKTIEHDYKEKFRPSAPLPQFPADPNLLTKVQNYQKSLSASSLSSSSSSSSFSSPLPNGGPIEDLLNPSTIHIGPIASGDEDIASAQRANELFKATAALAVAWEGVGGAKACKFNKVPFLEIRVITDNARDAVADSFLKNLGHCMHKAAYFINELFG